MRSTYTYFDNGWIKTQTDQHAVNGSGDPVTPVGDRKSTYDYDAQGHQTKWLRGNGAGSGGRTTLRQYWPNGLLARRKADTGDAAARSYGYGYNAADSLTELADHQVRSDGLARQTGISYDEVERPLVVDETWGSGKDTEYGYDSNSNPTRVFTETDGSSASRGGKTTVFKYDSTDRERSMGVTATGQTGPARVTTTSVYPSGQVSRRTKSMGATETFFYDPLSRLSRRTHSTSARNPVVDYDYDGNGNRSAAIAQIGGIAKPETFTYNARDQLVDWQRRPDAKPLNGVQVTRIEYAYNGAGALARQVRSISGAQPATTVFDMGDDDQLDVAVTSQPGALTTKQYYRYDSRGNTTCAGASVDSDVCTDGKKYVYDAFDRQTSARNGGAVLSNSTVYDALDRRDARCDDPACSGGAKRDFGYYGLTEKLSMETKANGELRTYDRDSQLVARGQDTTPSTGTPAAHTFRPYVLDDQGTVTELENGSSGVIEASYEYDPYGDTTFGDKTGDQPGVQAAKDNPIRFQGFTWEPDGRQYDMQARNYQPDIARFLSIDQYEAADGDMALQADPYTQHRYSFLGGNPSSRIEYDGHKAAPQFSDAPHQDIAGGGTKGKVRQSDGTPVSGTTAYRNAAAAQQVTYNKAHGITAVGAANVTPAATRALAPSAFDRFVTRTADNIGGLFGRPESIGGVLARAAGAFCTNPAFAAPCQLAEGSGVGGEEFDNGNRGANSLLAVGSVLLGPIGGLRAGGTATVENAAGRLLSGQAAELGAAKTGASGLGDLTKAEVGQIQGVVDRAGRPLDVVGSAAKAERRGVGTDLPVGKGVGTRSDIDYVVGPSSQGYYKGFEHELPGLDPLSGLINGTHNPFTGPGVRFEPGAAPRYTPGHG